MLNCDPVPTPLQGHTYRFLPLLFLNLFDLEQYPATVEDHFFYPMAADIEGELPLRCRKSVCFLNLAARLEPSIQGDRTIRIELMCLVIVSSSDLGCFTPSYSYLSRSTQL